MSNNLNTRMGGLGRIFRRNGIYPFVFALLAILLLIQVVRFLWVIATPLGPVGDWKSSEVQVLSPQSRLTLFSSFDPFFRTGPAQQTEIVTSLQLTLYGIRQNVASGLGSAILAGPDGVQDSFAVGQEIMAGVVLDSVQFDHVILDRGGVKETLYLDQSVPAETVGGEEPIVGAAAPALSPALTSIPNVASFAARNVDGKVTGIAVSPSGDGQLFRTAGFRNGDIIKSINGVAVTSTGDIEALKSQIGSGGKISVEVERGADTVPIAINLGNQ